MHADATGLDQYTLFACALLIGIYGYMAVQPDAIHDQVAIWMFSIVWGAGNIWFLGKSKSVRLDHATNTTPHLCPRAGGGKHPHSSASSATIHSRTLVPSFGCFHESC